MFRQASQQASAQQVKCSVVLSLASKRHIWTSNRYGRLVEVVPSLTTHPINGSNSPFVACMNHYRALINKYEQTQLEHSVWVASFYDNRMQIKNLEHLRAAREAIDCPLLFRGKAIIPYKNFANLDLLISHLQMVKQTGVNEVLLTGGSRTGVSQIMLSNAVAAAQAQGLTAGCTVSPALHSLSDVDKFIATSVADFFVVDLVMDIALIKSLLPMTKHKPVICTVPLEKNGDPVYKDGEVLRFAKKGRLGDIGDKVMWHDAVTSQQLKEPIMLNLRGDVMHEDPRRFRLPPNICVVQPELGRELKPFLFTQQKAKRYIKQLLDEGIVPWIRYDQIHDCIPIMESIEVVEEVEEVEA